MFFQQFKSPEGKNTLKLYVAGDIYPLVEKKIQEKSVEKLSKEAIDQLIEEYTVIEISSFNNLRRDSVNIWKEMFDSVEYVFGKLSDENVADFIACFIEWHYAIVKLIYILESSDKQVEILHEFCIEISKEIVELEERINLYKHIIDYGNKLPIIENPNIGTREQDIDAITFHSEEIREVCCLVVMMKIFLPIIATMISASKKPTITKNILVEGSNKTITKKQKVIDTNMKEVYCLHFLEPVLKLRFQNIYDKLFTYSTHFVEKRRKKFKANQCSDVFMNHSLIEMNVQVIANVLCKKCIHLTLFSKSENIMGFILSEITKKISSIEHMKNVYFIRNIQMGSDGEDEGNESQLEADSIHSNQTMDIEPMIKWMSNICVETVLKENVISEEWFDTIVNYNFKSLGYLETHTQVFLNTVFTTHFKTCEAIYLLDNFHTIRLLSLAQIVAVKKKYFDLAIRLTALLKPTEDGYEKATPSPESDKIVFHSNEAASKIYSSALGCKTRLDPKDKNRTLAEDILQKIRDIGVYFTTYKTYVNIEPSLGLAISPDLKNGMVYSPTKFLLHQFCQMMDEKL